MSTVTIAGQTTHPWACSCDGYLLHLDTYLDELQWYLAIHFDIPISISALQDNLAKAGLSRKILHKIACECDKVHWAEFLYAI